MTYDHMEMHTPPPEGPICDFCSSPDVQWTYPCRDHARKTEHALAISVDQDGSLSVDEMSIDGFSSGNWAACPACHALIRRGDRDRLARRSAKRMLRLMDAKMSLSNAIAHVRRLHDQFWSNRTGDPFPANEQEAR